MHSFPSTSLMDARLVDGCQDFKAAAGIKIIRDINNKDPVALLNFRFATHNYLAVRLSIISQSSAC